MRVFIRNSLIAMIGLVIVLLITRDLGKRYFLSKLVTKQLIQMRIGSDCNPRTQACSAVHDKRTIVFRLDESVHYLKPFQVNVIPYGFEQTTIKSITTTFSMLGMEMGLNQFKMSEIGTGQWQGQVILPVCSSRRTDWIVEVLLETDESLYRAEYPLQVD